LPTEPVTPKIVAWLRSRAARPSAWSAANTSSTSTCGRSIGWATIAAAAPAAKAASTNVCPSWTVPGMATNRKPGATSRLSKVTPVTSNGALAVPPVAAAISALVQRGVTAVPPCERSSWGGEPCEAWWRGRRCRRLLPLHHSLCGEWFPSPSRRDGEELWSTARSRRALPRDQRIVEREHPVADDLAGLVALAGDEHDIARAGDADCLGDRVAPAGDLGLAARIVVGDDDHVRQARRDRAHLWALALIAVAARAEHRDQAPLDVGPQRGDRRFERIGGVGIVDIDRGARPADHRAL